MAKLKVTFDEVKSKFAVVSTLFAGNVQLLSTADPTKCVLVVEGNASTYSCSALKGHLDFMWAMPLKS